MAASDMTRDPKLVHISEARLNDMCYMVLKHAFFMHLTPNGCPRECDIRVCMDMSVPERIKSVAHAILRPDERSGRSHSIFYDVDPERVFDECITYIEDHWIKRGLWAKEEWTANKRKWMEELVPVLLKTQEEDCGVDL